MNSIERKRNVTVIIVAAIFAIGISANPSENVKAQLANSNVTGGSSQNQTNILAGVNITGTIPLGPTIAKAIASQVHVSLANASMTAEKAIGANAHAAAVRIGVVHGFLVYMALVLDSSNNFHGVLVDPGTGKVLASTPISFAALGNMMGGGGMMGMMTGPGMSGYGTGTTQHGMMRGPGLTPHGMMNGPGIMMGHP